MHLLPERGNLSTNTSSRAPTPRSFRPHDRISRTLDAAMARPSRLSPRRQTGSPSSTVTSPSSQLALNAPRKRRAPHLRRHDVVGMLAAVRAGFVVVGDGVGGAGAGLGGDEVAGAGGAADAAAAARADEGDVEDDVAAGGDVGEANARGAEYLQGGGGAAAAGEEETVVDAHDGGRVSGGGKVRWRDRGGRGRVLRRGRGGEGIGDKRVWRAA